MRKPNQDNYIIKKNVTGIENAWLLSVCDGHGDHGHFVSEFIKKVFPQVLQNLSRGLNPTENLNLKGLGQQRPAQIGKTLKKSPEQQEEEPTQLQKPLYDVFTMPAEQRDQLITLAYKALQEKMVISGKHDSVMSGSTFVSVFFSQRMARESPELAQTMRSFQQKTETKVEPDITLSCLPLRTIFSCRDL